jgi:PAS domain S-box-containing protein
MGAPDYLVLILKRRIIMNNELFVQMEKEMGWSRDLLYQLVDNVKDYAIFVTEPDGRIVTWNRGAENIFGYQPEDVIGQFSSITFTEEDRTNHVPEQEMQTALEQGSAEDERWHLRKDGSYFFASGIMTSLYLGDQLTGYAKIARDVTERIRLQERLQESYDSLEFKVGERTRELNESNKTLRLEVITRQESERLRVALLRKIVGAQEDERKRIAREIHDSIGQQMTGIKLKLHALLARFEEDKEISEYINQITSITDQIDSDVDFLVWELRPSVLDTLGLSAALKNFVQEWTLHFRVPADFQELGFNSKKLRPEIEINLYRIGQEALNNVAKHAKAANVSVLLEKRNDKVILIIEDDGIGFEVNKKSVLTGDDRGMGLLGMKERAELIGGTLEIESSPGNGTTIYVQVTAEFDKENG